jgi:hypothetical protein
MYEYGHNSYCNSLAFPIISPIYDFFFRKNNEKGR